MVASAHGASAILSPLPSALAMADLPTPPLMASGSSSPLILSENDELPTPKDAHFVGATSKSGLLAPDQHLKAGSGSSSRRKNRISWAVHHAASCSSSPRHRYHPYKTTGLVEAGKKASPLAAYLGRPTMTGGSSSSPSGSATRSRYVLKPQRSILKAIKRSSVSLTASPGHALRSTPLSPARAARQPSSPFQLPLGSKSPRRSPYKHSPRVPQSPASVALATFGGNPLFPFSPATVVRKKHALGEPTTLTEVTRANGIGRRHIVSFPDLRASAAASSKPDKLADVVLASQESSASASADLQLGKAVDVAPPPPMSLLAALATFGSPKPFLTSMLNGGGETNAGTKGQPLTIGSNNDAGTSQVNLGLGIGSGSSLAGEGNARGLGPAFDEQPPPSSSGPAATTQPELDPRSYIISAMRTIRFSLAGPACSAAAVVPGGEQPQQREIDCFDSSPVDFQARNLVDGTQSRLDTSNGSNLRAPPPVHLRELEGAYAAIFTYAHQYITQRHLLLPAHGYQWDELDEAFAEGAEALISGFEREIHNILHPVPVSAQAETNAQELAQAHASAAAAQKAVRHALLYRSGRAASDEEAAAPSPPAFTSSSSPLALPPAGQQQQGGDAADDVPASSPPELPDSTPPVAPALGAAGKPKKLGRSTAEMRRRRGELNVAEAAVQAFGTLISCERFWKSFPRTSPSH